jgi:hypothetical protein
MSSKYRVLGVPRKEAEEIEPCSLASFFWRGVSLVFIPENAYDKDQYHVVRMSPPLGVTSVINFFFFSCMSRT